MKIIVSITDGKKTYSEDVTEEQEEDFRSFPAVLRNKKITFETWNRELKPFPFTTAEMDKFNTRDENSHFIYGWAECFGQSDDVPMWMSCDDVELITSVKHEFTPDEIREKRRLQQDRHNQPTVEKTGEICDFDCEEQGIKKHDCNNCTWTPIF